MLLELATGLLLWFRVSSDPFWIINTLGLVVLWGATAFWQVPLHYQLPLADGAARLTLILQLVLSKWLRTIVWTPSRYLAERLAPKAAEITGDCFICRSSGESKTELASSDPGSPVYLSRPRALILLMITRLSGTPLTMRRIVPCLSIKKLMRCPE